MRFAYEPAPWLAPLNTPMIAATAGLGTGGGAGVQTVDSSGFGEIEVAIGTAPSAAGSIKLTFPSTPPTLFISGDQDFGPLTQTTNGNSVIISWTAAVFTYSKRKIHYEWAVSS